MLVYVFVLIWILFVNIVFFRPKYGLSTDICIQEEMAPKLQVFLTMGCLVFFVGLRSGVADTRAYIGYFKYYSYTIKDLFQPSFYLTHESPLFLAINIICKAISSDYHFYLFSVAATEGVLIAFAFRKYTKYYGNLIVLFMLSGGFVWMVNGIRQFLAVALIFNAFDLLIEKKLVKYLIVILAASLIHKTAIIMIPVTFIVLGDAYNKKMKWFILFGILSVAFVGKFESLLSVIIQDTEYDGYTSKFASDDGSNILRTLVYSVPIVIAFVKKDEIEQLNSVKINLCINLSIVCVISSLIANFTSGILIGRIPIYFSLYGLVLMIELIFGLFTNSKAVLCLGMYIFYLIYFFLVYNYQYYSNLLFGGKWIPAL